MPRRGILGIPLPLLIGIVIVLLVLFVLGFIGGALGRNLLGDIGLGFLNVPQPRPELPPEIVFHIFGFPITNSIIGAWITIVFLVVFSWAVTRRLKLIPNRLQSLFEYLLGWLHDFCQSVAGEKYGRVFFPVVATLFLFVAFNAWLSLIPGFGSIEIEGLRFHDGNWVPATVHLIRGANTDINMPLALAFASFFIVLFIGLKNLGPSYLEQYVNLRQFFRGIGQAFRGKLKDGLMGVFLGVIEAFVGGLELLSHLIRILSLTFRLFGNMTAGEILLLVTAFLIPWLFALPFYGLELLVGFLQAMIFAGLTLIYLTMAVAGHGEESH
jgi:F-type H+-transporting ATPase subunit a